MSSGLRPGLSFERDPPGKGDRR